MTRAPELYAPPSMYTFGLVRLILAGILLAALINRDSSLTLVCLLILVIVGLAGIWSRFAANALELGIDADRRRVFPGETFTIEVSAANRRLLPVWVQAAMPVDSAITPGPDGSPDLLNAGLLHTETARLRWTLTARKRGVYRLGPDHVLVGDLFGLFPRKKENAPALELLVYPRVRPIRQLDPVKQELFGAPGARSPVTDPVYILGVRDYQPGRPSRFIHWQASARRGRFQEKVFEPSAQAKVLLILDAAGFEKEMAADEYELALELLASLTVDLDRRGIRVGLAADCVLNGARPDAPALAPIGSRPERILEILARARLKAANRPLEFPARLSARQSQVVYCCLEFDDKARSLKEYFQSRGRSFIGLSVRQGSPDEAAVRGFAEIFLDRPVTAPANALELKNAQSGERQAFQPAALETRCK